MGRYEVKGLDMVRDSKRRISRELLESEYSWDREGSGKTEIDDDKDSVEYIQGRIDVCYTHTQKHKHKHPCEWWHRSVADNSM